MQQLHTKLKHTKLKVVFTDGAGFMQLHTKLKVVFTDGAGFMEIFGVHWPSPNPQTHLFELSISASLWPLVSEHLRSCHGTSNHITVY